MTAKFFYVKTIFKDDTFVLHVCDRVGLRMLKSLFSDSAIWIQELQSRCDLPKGLHVKKVDC